MYHKWTDTDRGECFDTPNSPMPTPLGLTQTNAITVIYIWGWVVRDETARPKWPMQGWVLGEGEPPIPTSYGSGEVL